MAPDNRQEVVLDKGYEQYEGWKRWDAEEFGAFTPAQAEFYDQDIFRWLPSRKLKILEIGFGNGSFLGYARSKGHEIVGVEILPAQIQRARDAGFAVTDSIAGGPIAHFDAVVAVDVLEHIPSPDAVQFLSSVKNALTPGGFAVMKFPNGQSPFGLVNQHGDVTHVNIITDAKVRYLAEAAGMETVKVGNPYYSIRHRGVRLGVARALAWPIRHLIELVLGFSYYGRKVPLAIDLVAVMKRPS